MERARRVPPVAGVLVKIPSYGGARTLPPSEMWLPLSTPRFHWHRSAVATMMITESVPEQWQAFDGEHDGEAVASVGDGELLLRRGLFDESTLDAVLSAARTSMHFDTQLDTVDGEATFHASIVEDGETVDENLASVLQPVLQERLLPYLRERYACPDVVLADALVRRYLPEERPGLSAHYDVSAFATAIVPLVAPSACTPLPAPGTPMSRTIADGPLTCWQMAVGSTFRAPPTSRRVDSCVSSVATCSCTSGTSCTACM